MDAGICASLNNLTDSMNEFDELQQTCSWLYKRKCRDDENLKYDIPNFTKKQNRKYLISLVPLLSV